MSMWCGVVSVKGIGGIWWVEVISVYIFIIVVFRCAASRQSDEFLAETESTG